MGSVRLSQNFLNVTLNQVLNLIHGLVQGLVHEMHKQACPEEMPKQVRHDTFRSMTSCSILLILEQPQCPFCFLFEKFFLACY